MNFNLRRKVTRMKTKKRLDQLSQFTNNEEDTNLIQNMLSNADKHISTVLDPDSNEMELWEIHCEHISSVNKSDRKNTRTRHDPITFKLGKSIIS